MKSAELHGISDYKHTHLHLHLYSHHISATVLSGPIMKTHFCIDVVESYC